MKIIDVLRTDEPVIDKYTFVLDEVDPETGWYAMIATDETGWAFSQFTEGVYDPEGDNSHLGERPQFMSEQLLNHILERMGDE